MRTVTPLLISFSLFSLSIETPAQEVLQQHHGEPNRVRLRAAGGYGDLNDDGYSDIVTLSITSPNTSNLTVHSGRDATVLWSLSWSGTQSIGAVVHAGDLNGDGFADLAVGRPVDGSMGVVDVLSGIDGSVLDQWEGTQPRSGGVLSNVGDVNNDGRSDFSVGAISTTDFVSILSGASGEELFRIFVEPTYIVRGQGVGDLDDDGHDDFAIIPGVGSVAAVHSGLDGRELRSFSGRSLDVKAAGDVNGDGRADLLVSEDVFRSNRFRHVTTVYSGLSDRRIHTFEGSDDDGAAGFATSANDLNQDGHDDILVGRPYANSNGGAVDAYSGRDGSTLFRVFGEGAGNLFGIQVSAAGDINRDGTPDFVVTAFQENNFAYNTGALIAFSPEFRGATWANYGEGWPGSGGRVPELSLSVNPKLGFPTVVEAESLILRSGLGYLLVGPQPADIPTPLGGTLLVEPSIPVPLRLEPGINPFSWDVPESYELQGLPLYMQLLSMDPGASAGVAFSRGLRAELGY